MTIKKEPLVGSFISTAGGIDLSVHRALEIGCNTMQIFTKSNRMWKSKPLTDKEITAFKKNVKEADLKKIAVHASYLINIASNNPETEKKSVAALIEEVQRCELLDIPYLVLHPGSHTGAGMEKGIETIAKNLDIVFKKAPGSSIICLETMAGQGTNLGSTFEQISDIINAAKKNDRLGVCLDTCHIFTAGYDITTPKKYEEVIEQFDKIIGIKRLKCIHLNDSKMPLGSNKDRHANLGQGLISLKAFECLMNDKRLEHVPKHLETPDESLYPKEIILLRKMVK
jgi:deoxyribonuclease-4